jgi:hypothetical protein
MLSEKLIGQIMQRIIGNEIGRISPHIAVENHLEARGSPIAAKSASRAK